MCLLSVASAAVVQVKTRLEYSDYVSFSVVMISEFRLSYSALEIRGWVLTIQTFIHSEPRLDFVNDGPLHTWSDDELSFFTC